MYDRQLPSPDPVTLSLPGVLGNKEDTIGINFEDTGIAQPHSSESEKAENHVMNHL